MRILLVEDDDRIAKPLAEGFKNEYYVVEIATDGLSGWEYAQGAEFEMILLDLMLPKLDGITLCKRLKEAKSKASIFMLTAKDTTDDNVIGLDAGADDYLVKPFRLKELAARVRALSCRSYELKPQVLSYEELQLNPSTGEVTYENNLLSLTPKKYLILEYFLRHPQQILTRSAILDKLWEFDNLSGEGTIKTHITNLRSKLKAAGSKNKLIEMVYGISYRLSSL
ncbi:response regulator transcription factor [Pleurocapsa sp. FMAR1]|uniref:response regulator transcription factor n=1 Tax=Pleurocapsa sp. FMAR1 TaxID=3040204 RepID=UPI0029C66285|nr:response regulator transcription factor [Pleurocapsa sp. FMAR1]